MVEKIVLENGARILLERINYVRSASVGITINTGSRYENDKNNGVSHFIEHMLFKGTDTMSSEEIAQEMDAIGGNYNAFTSRDNTNVYFRALDRDLEAGINIMTDMILHPKFAPEDVELERSVICEELDMSEDTPDELVYDLMMEACYPDNPVGKTIIGTRDTLAGIDADVMRAYMSDHYVGSNIVAAISGNFDDHVIELLKERLSQLKKAPAPEFQPAVFHKNELFKEKKIEQNHVCLGFESFNCLDKRRHALNIFTSILGAGMSSRLFRKVREESGLCYNVNASYIPMPDTGLNCIYVGTNPSTQQKAIDLIYSETARLLKDGPTADEFERTRKFITSSILMSLESTYARMTSNTRGELQYGRVMTAEEAVAAYDKVTIENVIEAGRAGYDLDHAALAVVGTV